MSEENYTYTSINIFVLILLYGVGFWSINNDQQSRTEIISLQANPCRYSIMNIVKAVYPDILTTVNDTGWHGKNARRFLQSSH